MNALTVEAPAKLNLSLRVLRKRPDGFHDINSLMVKLPGLADTLRFSEADETVLTCDDPQLPVDASNLVLRAADAFAEVTGVPSRHAIHLEKRIPSGAGLGGGSSDAAATLLALNTIHDRPLSAKKLHEIASSIGSDVPFFLHPAAARCSGRGEIIEAAENPPPLRIVLLKPQFASATPQAYARWSESRELPGVPYGAQSCGQVELANDLERPVFAKFRFLAELKVWLLNRAETRAALLCGSGSTMTAVLDEEADADALIKAALSELDPTLWSWQGRTGN
jgi:4-diphosphocytidyl-2-C-methyl-D-erythritol kinase